MKNTQKVDEARAQFVKATNDVLDAAFDIGRAIREGKLIHPESEVAERLVTLLTAGCEANDKLKEAEEASKVKGQ